MAITLEFLLHPSQPKIFYQIHCRTPRTTKRPLPRPPRLPRQVPPKKRFNIAEIQARVLSKSVGVDDDREDDEDDDDFAEAKTQSSAKSLTSSRHTISLATPTTTTNPVKSSESTNLLTPSFLKQFAYTKSLATTITATPQKKFQRTKSLPIPASTTSFKKQRVQDTVAVSNAHQVEPNSSETVPNTFTPEPPSRRRVKIYYGTRTHKQWLQSWGARAIDRAWPSLGVATSTVCIRKCQSQATKTMTARCCWWVHILQVKSCSFLIFLKGKQQLQLL